MFISLFNSTYSKQPEKEIEFEEFIKNIRDGTWQDTVLKTRTKEFKKELNAAVTPSGTFKQRSTTGLINHSGILNIDLDQKDNIDTNLIDIRDELSADPYLYAMHVSIGGLGLALYIKINKNKHLESYYAIEKYLSDKYKIICDPACKDVSRLRYVSYDPEAHINTKSKVWSDFLPKKELKPFNFNPIFTNNDIKFVFDQIKNRCIDLTNNYSDWIKIGFSIVSEFKESGREYFHLVSKFHPKYSFEKCNKKYDSLLHSGAEKFTISTFLWICKQNGINIKSENTKKCEIVSKLRKQDIGKNGGCKDDKEAKKSAIDYLTKIEKIDVKEAEEVIDKVLKSNSFDNEKSDVSDIEQLEIYVKGLPIKFNIITKNVEFSGMEITDKMENSIFLNCKRIFPKSKISKDLILSILNSDRIHEFNPFLDFIESNKHLKPKGRILELLDCLMVKNDSYAPHCATFIEKWLLSIMASVHGTYSLLILVFVGEQMTNKTNFFRNLLPAELKDYFVESKLDQDKDDQILMSKKLIILDDEFAGKSKTESKKLKELSSKQKITLRKSYGRNAEDYNRIAVLCGTSNDTDIINDPTGNRRIIPVNIIDIDFKKYESIDKTELFMELYWKWKEIGNAWMLTKEDVNILNSNTTDFVEITMEEDLILKHFEPANEHDINYFYTATEMLNYCEGFLSKQRLYHKKFGQILKKLGFIRIQKKGVGFGYLAKKKVEI